MNKTHILAASTGRIAKMPIRAGPPPSSSWVPCSKAAGPTPMFDLIMLRNVPSNVPMMESRNAQRISLGDTTILPRIKELKKANVTIK
jgi:hypothetical protein